MFNCIKKDTESGREYVLMGKIIKHLVTMLIICIMVIGLIAIVWDIKRNNDSNYKISHSSGNTYYVDSYTENPNGKCIYLPEIETRLCGDFLIQKLNVEK